LLGIPSIIQLIDQFKVHLKHHYIWDDRCNAEDAAVQIGKVYALDRTMRKELGKTGRSWAVDEVGFTGEAMGARAINAIDQLFNTWTPREKYELINVNDVKEDIINHKFVY
jgi:hypothetical protein